MGRSVITDLLQVYPFWVMDAGPVDPIALPMLTPIFGFSGISAPEITAETYDIAEGNWYFKKKILKTADVSNVVMQRGVTFYDSDFWKWMFAGISGDMSNSKFGIGGASLAQGGLTPRRSLLLVQFFTRSPVSLPEGSDIVLQGALTAAGISLAGGGLADTAARTAEVAAIATAAHFLGPFEFTARLPAKAWLLHGAIPVRYKAGTDFDAQSSAVSIQELELAIEMMEEVSLVA